MGEAKKSMSAAEAGRLGGNSRKAAIVPEGFAAMGREGGATTMERHGPEHYSAIGKKGGAAARRAPHRSRKARKAMAISAADVAAAALASEGHVSLASASRPSRETVPEASDGSS